MFRYTLKEIVLCAATGVLYPASFMVPYAGILSWVLLVPLFLAIGKKSPGRAFKLGLLSGVIANFIGTYWLVGTLSRFGGFPLPVSFIFILMLSAYSGLSFAIFAYFASRLGFFKKPGVLSVLLIAALWTSIEYLFPFLFPFGIANAEADYLPLIQIFDLFGVYGLSFIIVVVNLTLMRIIEYLSVKESFPLSEAVLSVLLVTAALAYGFVRLGQIEKEMASADKIKVGMVQANFDFLEKTENQEPVVTARHKEMSRTLESDNIIIWPETALQAWFSNSSDNLVIGDETAVPDMEGKYFIVGGMSFTQLDPGKPITDENVTEHNTAFLTDSDGLILSRYHKIKLLLFGEYLPFTKYIPALRKISPATGNFTPGDDLTLFEIKDMNVRIAPLICYEDIIPSFSRKFAAKGANLLVNITNDAWFGKTIAPYQHFLISIPRAVETRKYLLRSTNTGISAIVEPTGRVAARTDIFVRTNLEGEVALMDGGQTLYTRTGNMFPLVCLVFWAGFGLAVRLRAENPGHGA